MKRRAFLETGAFALLAAGGFGLGAALTPREARAQRGPAQPIAIAATSGTPRAIARVYAGRNANELVMMLRIGQRETWRLLTMPPRGREALQARLAEGALPVRFEQNNQRIDLDARLQRRGSQVMFTISGGRVPIEGVATAPEEPGPTTQLGFLAAIVAIIAIMALVAIVGMITGNPMRLKFRCGGMGCETDWSIGREEPTAPAGTPPADGFMANPECDLLPPMLC